MRVPCVRRLRSPWILPLLAPCLFATAPIVSGAEIIVLRSGNAGVGNPDPNITMLVGTGAAPLSATPFGPAEFDAACGQTQAIVTQPHPAWAQQLACDPDAQWIGTDASATPASALYCYPFEIETCCIEHATLEFCWAADDILGDPATDGANQDAVYLNGVAVSPRSPTGISGSS